MTKAIKDIGTFRSRHPEDGGIIDFAPLLDETHHLCILTFEERRKLVREVWDEALKAALTIDDPLRDACNKYFEDWLREQDL